MFREKAMTLARRIALTCAALPAAALANQGIVVFTLYKHERIGEASVSIVRCNATTNPAQCNSYYSGSTDASGVLQLPTAAGDFYVQAGKYLPDGTRRNCKAVRVYPDQFAHVTLDLAKGCFY